MSVEAVVEPKHDTLVALQYIEGVLEDARYGGSPKTRDNAAASWRLAYFRAIREGLIEPYSYKEPDRADDR